MRAVGTRHYTAGMGKRHSIGCKNEVSKGAFLFFGQDNFKIHYPNQAIVFLLKGMKLTCPRGTVPKYCLVIEFVGKTLLASPQVKICNALPARGLAHPRHFFLRSRRRL